MIAQCASHTVGVLFYFKRAPSHSTETMELALATIAAAVVVGAAAAGVSSSSSSRLRFLGHSSDTIARI